MRTIIQKIAIALTVITFVVGIILIVKIRERTDYFKEEQNKIVGLLNFNERLLDVKEAIPLYGEWVWSGKYEAYHAELKAAKSAYSEAQKFSYWLTLLVSVYVAAIVLLNRKKQLWFAITLGLLTSAMLMLLAGLFTPLLELEAYKENLEIKIEVDAGEMLKDLRDVAKSIPFVGNTIEGYVDELIPGMEGERYKWHKVYPDKMYFFYENKGLFDVLHVLWQTNNVPIALIVGLFSFLVPAIKLLFSFILLFKPVRSASRYRGIVNFLTKFSMLDVMVVSVFLTYFTFDELSTGVDTSSKLMMGVYFFTAYVILAILSGYTMDKYLNRRLADARDIR